LNANGPHRAVVTGIGIVSPLGIGVRSFWERVLAGSVGIAPLTRFDASEFSCRIAGEINDFDPADYLDGKRLRWTDRFAQFSIAASRLALEDAGFSLEGHEDETGVYIGSALGGLAYAEDQHVVFRERGIKHVRPLLAISVFGGAATTQVALELGIRGPNLANGNSCAAGSVAIGEAFRAVARGDVRSSLAGGVEAPLSPLIFGAFSIIRAMSTNNADPAHASRPFDIDRDGFVMAEGAGMLLIERLDDAVSRGARIYGEITGFGLTGDAHHMTAPDPQASGSSRAMQNALREARVAPDEVELIDAHGSSSKLNDATETLAIKRTFGAAGTTIPVVATKGQHGHALGATGAWEVALTLLALREGRLPGAVNLEHRDPECDVDVVRATRVARPRLALSNSTGFGGINAALVLRNVEA
jgi:3-oxoacyl-[acyl-carrier-protein] synthase II